MEISYALVDLGVFPIWDIPGVRSQVRMSWWRLVLFLSAYVRKMPPASALGLKFSPFGAPVTSGYSAYCLFFWFWCHSNVHIHIPIHINIQRYSKTCDLTSLHPHASSSNELGFLGPG
jgi:hypothetical protein